MPYSKQFFSGGPNSIRAFHINSVGPGTFYQNPDELVFLQLGGDIKLEANTEYRFSIYRFLKGALFVDAGNVWLIKSNPANIGTPFSFFNFYEGNCGGCRSRTAGRCFIFCVAVRFGNAIAETLAARKRKVGD
jgi:outer membrane protein assembly factor BamA